MRTSTWKLTTTEHEAVLLCKKDPAPCRFRNSAKVIRLLSLGGKSSEANSWRHTTSRCGPPTPHVPRDIGTVTGSAPVGRSSLILNPHLAGPTSRPGRGRAARAHRAFQINGFLGLGRLTRHSTRGNGERRLRAPSIVMTKSTGRGATATTTTSMMVPSTMCHRSPMHGSA